MNRIAGLGALLCAALAGCTGGASDEPLSCVLITFDTTRADALGSYGAPEGVTPHLDRLAAEGLRYERAYTVAPLTLPAHASILTGLYPLRHTVRDNGFRRVPSSARTLAEKAAERGFDTAAFVAAAVLDASFGLDQGFDVYDSPARKFGSKSSRIKERPAGEVVDAALAWLDGRDAERPFLMWVHVFDPHGPYEPPPRFRGGALRRNPYLGEVAYADHEIGRLLDRLRADGLLERALVCVVSDHGEAFGEHDEPTHGGYCYETTMRVPFLLRYPDGHRAGERSDRVVSVVDVFPTLAEAMGLPVVEDVDGRSLFRRVGAEDRGVYFESYKGYLSYGWSPLAGWLDARGKYLHSSEPQFFDPVADPEESRDLIAERAGDLADYRRAIALLADRPALALDEAGPLDGDVLADVRSLGYADVTVAADSELPGPLDETDRPSPASMARSYAESLRAQELINRGSYAEAERLLRGVLATNPKNFFALDRLSTCLLLQERPQEALPYLLDATRFGPPTAGTFFNLGVANRAVGNADEALKAMRRAVDLDPGQGIFHQGLVELLREEGLDEEADERERLRQEREAGV